MSESSQSPQGSSEKSDNLRSLAFKGVIGAITLVGTTAIPLMVQRALQDTAPVVSPPPTVPAQVVPAQVQSTTPIQTESTQTQTPESVVNSTAPLSTSANRAEADPVPESDGKQEKPRNNRKSRD